MKRYVALALVAVGLSACGGGPTPSAGQVGAFVRQHTDCGFFGYSRPQWVSGPGGSGEWIIYTTTGPVSDVHRIHPDGTGDETLIRQAGMAQVSPDGAYLLYLQVNQVTGAVEAGLLDMATKQTRLIGQYQDQAQWLPDSKSIAYFDRGYTRMQIDTLEKGPVPGVPAEVTGWVDPPIWSPDGRAFAYSSRRDQQWKVSIGDVSTGRITPVEWTPGAGCAYENEIPMAWSPDPGDASGSGPSASPGPPGPMLALLHWCGSHAHLRIIDAGGTQLYEWGSIQSNLMPPVRWSPGTGGGRIAYVLLNGSRSPLYTANVDGSDARQLDANAAEPVWSPDGKQLAFVGSDSAGLAEIFAINADPGSGAGKRPVTQNPNAGRICLH